MHAHHELTESGVTARDASTLTGIARCTATRDKACPTAVVPAATTAGRVPENKLTEAERRGVLDVLCSARFVDRSPIEVYAQLLDEGIYLCSVSTMYRILRENAQVKERRPAGSPSLPSLSGTGGDRTASGVFVGHHKAARPGQRHLF